STAQSAPLKGVAARALLWSGLIVLCGVAAHRHATGILNHDVAWLLVAARRLLEGGRFGTDIYELDPPGAVLIYVPAAWWWKVTRCSIEIALAGYVLTLTMLSLALVGWQLKRELGAQGGLLGDAYLLFAATILL